MVPQLASQLSCWVGAVRYTAVCEISAQQARDRVARYERELHACCAAPTVGLKVLRRCALVMGDWLQVIPMGKMAISDDYAQTVGDVANIVPPPTQAMAIFGFPVQIEGDLLAFPRPGSLLEMASKQFIQKMGDLVTIFHCVQETQRAAILRSLSQTEGDLATVCSRAQETQRAAILGSLSQTEGDSATVCSRVQETQRAAILRSFSQTEGDLAPVCSRVKGSWVVIRRHVVQIEGNSATVCSCVQGSWVVIRGHVIQIEGGLVTARIQRT